MLRSYAATTILLYACTFFVNPAFGGSPDIISLRLSKEITERLEIPVPLRSVRFLALHSSAHYVEADASALEDLPNLTRLELNYSTFSPEFISSLAKLKTLKRVHFVNCGVNDRHLSELRSHGIAATVCEVTLEQLRPFEFIRRLPSDQYSSDDGTDAFEVFISADGSLEAKRVGQWRLEPWIKGAKSEPAEVEAELRKTDG